MSIFGAFFASFSLLSELTDDHKAQRRLAFSISLLDFLNDSLNVDALHFAFGAGFARAGTRMGRQRGAMEGQPFDILLQRSNSWTLKGYHAVDAA